MAFHYKEIKHYKRGAKWDDGRVRTCVRCGIEGAKRKKQAKYVALMYHDSSEYVLPVSYCLKHVPVEVKERA